jgi:2,3-bisphosphoglycerate-independent phosphoglycerate mutase
VTTAGGKMIDHSSGHISSEEGKIFIEELNKTLGSEHVRFYPGVGYRHVMVVKGYDFPDLQLQPPHDNIGIEIKKIMPRGKNADVLIDLIKKSENLLKDHKINLLRRNLKKNEATSIWLWGHGKKARMEAFEKKYGLKGTAITAVDLVKGLANLIGFDFIKVEGATGYFDTNYRAKGLAAIDAIKKYDIVLVHVEATDEAGHAGKAEIKKRALEEIDKYIVGPVMAELKKYEHWRILVMPDHPTPVSTQGHTGDAVPFAMMGDGISGEVHLPLGEKNAAKTGIKIDNGYQLMEFFLK